MSKQLKPHKIDLYSDELDWVTMTIPGADRPVKLSRLYMDPETKANVSLVDFPKGWRRPETGSYTASEEFVVLRGAISVSGFYHRAGDYVLLPARSTRAESSTPDGCLALAAFSGPPKWVPGTPEVPPVSEVTHLRADKAVRNAGADFQGSLRCVRQTPDVSATPMDLLGLQTATWALILPGSSAPPVIEPTVVRWW